MATRLTDHVASKAKRDFAIPKQLLLLIQGSNERKKIKPLSRPNVYDPKGLCGAKHTSTGNVEHFSASVIGTTPRRGQARARRA